MRLNMLFVLVAIAVGCLGCGGDTSERSDYVVKTIPIPDDDTGSVAVPEDDTTAVPQAPAIPVRKPVRLSEFKSGHYYRVIADKAIPVMDERRTYPAKREFMQHVAGVLIKEDEFQILRSHWMWFEIAITQKQGEPRDIRGYVAMDLVDGAAIEIEQD